MYENPMGRGRLQISRRSYMSVRIVTSIILRSIGRCDRLCFNESESDRRVLKVLSIRHPRADSKRGTSRLDSISNDIYAWDESSRYLLRDRDAIYGAAFRRRIKHMGMKEVLVSLSINGRSYVPLGG